MIECTSEYIWYKRKRKLKLKGFVAFFIVISILFGFCLYYKYFIGNQLCKLSSDYAYSLCTESVNEAIITSLNNQIKYSDLIKVEKNNNDDIVLITANSYKVNSIARDITNLSKINLTKKLSGGIPVPALTFTGIGIISGFGAPVNIKTLNVISVYCDFNSKFNSVGINQTLHSIYANITCEVRVNIPLNDKEEKFTSTVLITEAVLVGSVPEIYLNGKLFG